MPLERKPEPNLGSDTLWSIIFLYGGRRDHPLLGSGPSGALSGNLTVSLCQNEETEISCLLSRTFICGLQTKFETHFSLLGAWN